MPIALIGGTHEEIERGEGKLLLTRTQAAVELGVAERRVRDFVTSGELTPFDERLYGMPLYEAAAVRQLRASRLKRY